MTPAQLERISGLRLRFFAERPKQSPSDWCCENLTFDEPDNRGPFTLAGREYAREMIDDWADPNITDHVEVFGSQAGKTASIMGGAAWTLVNRPSRFVWVMPTQPTVRSFARTRWIPMLRRSACTSTLLPSGSRRHDFSTYEQTIGGSIIDMKWSNSPAALSSIPARVVILDEVDKFNEGGNKEADAVNLAEQRTKRFADPKKIKTSTPTLITGLIWQEFLKTDQRRRFMPCPHCGKFVVFVWSKQFTVFKLTGEEAEVVWDKEAKRKDGTWDLDRVERSAHYRCPHCAGRIVDAHKTVMDRDGVWRPTAKAASGYRGRHLSTLYTSSAQANIGKLAVKFLQDKQSLLGLQGFINGTLAEPYGSQDTLSQRTELISARIETTAEWRKLMTVDCQGKAPYFWHVKRAWNGGDSHGISAGPLDTWEEVRSAQTAEGIPDVGTFVDSGFGARSDADVYKECARFSELIPSLNRAIAIGWMPCKGMPGRKKWKDKKGALQPWFLADIDPFAGTSHAGQVSMNLLEFSGDYFKDILEALRAGKGGHKWSVPPEMATEEYWKHLDAEVKVAERTKWGKVQHNWQPRSKHWPNHLLDCEVMQVVAASMFELFVIER